MTHADRIREAERAVIEAVIIASKVSRDPDVGVADAHIAYNREERAVDALLALRAATCPKCGGMGAVFGDDPRMSFAPPCPAGCDSGRRRTT